MIGFRNEVGNEPISKWWDNGNSQIAFCRGKRGLIVFNNERTIMNVTLPSCLPPGLYCDVVSGSMINNSCSGKSFQIDGINGIRIELNSNGILALHTGVRRLYCIF